MVQVGVTVILHGTQSPDTQVSRQTARGVRTAHTFPEVVN